MKKEQKEMNNKGFSLVELIIVIAIMAILVGVLAPQYIKYVEKSRVATDMQNVQAMRTAVEVYTAGAEGLSDDVVITVKGGDTKTTEISSDDSNVTAAALGISTLDGTLSSSNWTDGTATYTYDHSSYTWTASGDMKNGTNDMKSVFGIATSE